MAVSDLVYIDPTGYNYVDFPTVLAFVQAIYTDLYGADVYLGADSQDGQWVAAQAQMIYDCMTVGASIFNSFSPVTAQGVGLSRVVEINGISREIPTSSTVDLTIVGTAGTTITNGIAIDILSQQWLLPSPTVIPSGGSITVTATAQNVGDITADANTVTSIYTPTLGWQTVNNSSASSAGAPVESDEDLRLRQAASTANPSLTVLEGTYGAIANLTGVTAVQVYENPTGTTDGNGLPPHSISAVVAGGDAMAIAQAIADHKTPGCATYGSTTETVYDNHGMPLVINFYVPTPAVISIQVVLTPFQGWSTDFEADIASALAAQINSTSIGDTIYLTSLYPVAYLPNLPAEGATYNIVSIELEKNSGGFSSSNIVLDFNEEATCIVADISFTT
jgi:uncharacterized phage protein gp47/JayE